MGKVLSRLDGEEEEHTKGWVRFMIHVDLIYKKSPGSRIRKGPVSMLVPASDLACKCPKIKTGK